MADVSRRTLLRTLGVGAVGLAGLVGYESVKTRRGQTIWHGLVDTVGHRNAAGKRIAIENARHGSSGWKMGAHATRPADDVLMQIKGYASKTSVQVGDSINFFVSVNEEQRFTIDVYRFGYYRGLGARHVASSPRLAGRPQASPNLDPAIGTITCDWAASWTLKVPSSWTSGMYMGVLTSAAGYRSYVPFVVRDDHPAKLLVVVPFTTYQAYNQFPFDGRLGKSLYYGWSRTALHSPTQPNLGGFTSQDRARCVSFDRPFAKTGVPKHAEDDQAFAYWAESHGYDVTYATSLDLHSGRLDLTKYAGVIFSGHDEYWSQQMRDHVTAAVAKGTSLAYMSANNVYWHIRCDAPTDAGEVRSMHCYKTDPDPKQDASGPTTQWRMMPDAPHRAEQGLLGVQYDGIVLNEESLIVQHADHWLWKNTGVRNGEEIPRLVGVEADGFNTNMPSPRGATQTLLSASPFTYVNATGPTRQIQNTSVCEMPSGATVFVAGTMNWPLALGKASRVDHRVQAATANLLSRILRESVA